MLKKSSYRLLFKSLISLLIIIGVVLTTQITMSNPNQICFLPQADDSYSFAHSVAINDKYLVVGDPGANRIVIYQKNSQNQWYRNREIYPPNNSTSYQRGNGFGMNLLLGENSLIVNNWSSERVTKKNNPHHPGSIFWGQYNILYN